MTCSTVQVYSFNNESAYETRTVVQEPMFIIQWSMNMTLPFWQDSVILNGLSQHHHCLTPPESFAVVFSSDEQRFSKLKFIKTYLSSCMTQERLSDLN